MIFILIFATAIVSCKSLQSLWMLMLMSYMRFTEWRTAERILSEKLLFFMKQEHSLVINIISGSSYFMTFMSF